MNGPTPKTYCAFLSYRHADALIAKRVHARLESFPIDKDLIGRETPRGPIPPTLRPIFRDRDDFVAGDLLSEQTLAALDASRALVLLASPNSAQSPYVNEEVRLFKWLHPDRPLVPLIIDGEPGGGARECFPPALRFKLDARGAITDQSENILAADLRETRDGFDLALAKVAAKLIGVAPDDLYRRAERERCRVRRLRKQVAAALVALALSSGGLALYSHWQGGQLTEKQLTLDEINQLVDRLHPIQKAQAEGMDERKALKEAITAIAQGAAVDPRKAQALRFLQEGKTREAEPLLLEALQERAKRRQRELKEDAADYRHLASIAALHEPWKARDYYAQAARLDPDNPDGLNWNGWFQQQANHLDDAERSYRGVLNLEGKGASEDQVFGAHNGLGDVLVRQGNLPEALKSYRAGLAIAERLAAADPGNAQAQRDLSVSYDRIGDVLVRQGNLPEALKSYRAGLAIRERLAAADPGNAQAQRDLSVSDNKIGDVLVGQGNLPEALKSYRAGLAIAERLAAADPGNAASAARSLGLLRQDRRRAGQPRQSRPRRSSPIGAGLAIRERLAAADPGNAASAARSLGLRTTGSATCW